MSLTHTKQVAKKRKNPEDSADFRAFERHGANLELLLMKAGVTTEKAQQSLEKVERRIYEEQYGTLQPDKSTSRR